MLGQYGLLYALKNSDAVEKLVILNTPLDTKAALRPELAAYKNPISFLRPKAGAAFDAMTYAANGLAYAMQYKDAQVGPGLSPRRRKPFLRRGGIWLVCIIPRISPGILSFPPLHAAEPYTLYRPLCRWASSLCKCASSWSTARLQETSPFRLGNLVYFWALACVAGMSSLTRHGRTGIVSDFHFIFSVL